MSTSAPLASDHFVIPTTQKAWRNVRRGKPSKALLFDDKAPVRTNLEKGEVLIKVQAAALNAIGYKTMELIPSFMAGRPRMAPELDFAGIVVNANGTNLKNGQEVFGCIVEDVYKSKQGSLSQYLALPADHVVTRPTNITPIQAAGVAAVAITAQQVLFDLGKVEPGMNIFINGGSTTVGASAIQLAKAIGCTVTVTASGKNEAYVKSLGADVFIDYTKGPVHEALERNPPSPKFHLMLEAVGNVDLPLYTHSEAYLAPNGIFISTIPSPDGFAEIPSYIRYMFEVQARPTWLGGTKRKWICVFAKMVNEDLKHIATLITEGKFRPLVDSVWSFEDALKAYDRLKTKRATGKVVIKVDPQVS